VGERERERECLMHKRAGRLKTDSTKEAERRGDGESEQQSCVNVSVPAGQLEVVNESSVSMVTGGCCRGD